MSEYYVMIKGKMVSVGDELSDLQHQINCLCKALGAVPEDTDTDTVLVIGDPVTNDDGSITFPTTTIDAITGDPVETGGFTIPPPTVDTDTDTDTTIKFGTPTIVDGVITIPTIIVDEITGNETAGDPISITLPTSGGGGITASVDANGLVTIDHENSDNTTDSDTFQLPRSEVTGVACDTPSLSTHGVVEHDDGYGNKNTLRHNVGENHINLGRTATVKPVLRYNQGLASGGAFRDFVDSYVIANPRPCAIIAHYHSVVGSGWQHTDGINIGLEADRTLPADQNGTDGDGMLYVFTSVSYGNLHPQELQQFQGTVEIHQFQDGLSMGAGINQGHKHSAESRIAPGGTYLFRTQRLLGRQINTKRIDLVFALSHRTSRIWYNDAEIV